MNGIYNIYTSMVTITVMKNVAALLSDHKNTRLGQKPVKSRPVPKPIVSACLRISAARSYCTIYPQMYRIPRRYYHPYLSRRPQNMCTPRAWHTVARFGTYGLRDTTSHDRQQSSERKSGRSAPGYILNCLVLS